MQEKNDKPLPPEKNDAYWKEKLSPEIYRIMRLKGTEPAFTGMYYTHNDSGIYACAACNTPLFESKTKYESGSGWPSFFDAIPDAIKTDTDYKLGYARTEIMCASCGGHLGHVFEDGPMPTGQRFCVNSASLQFQHENEK